MAMSDVVDPPRGSPSPEDAADAERRERAQPSQAPNGDPRAPAPYPPNTPYPPSAPHGAYGAPPPPYPPPPEYYQGYPFGRPPSGPPPLYAPPGAYPPGAYPPPAAAYPPAIAATAAVGPAGAARVGVWGGVVLPVLSAALSLAIYYYFLGLEFAIGLMLLLLVHEMGHYVVIRAKGLPAALPIFIPFLGAYVSMRKLPRTVRDEAEIALAGPLTGALGGAACYLAYTQTGDVNLLLLAYFSFLLNLVNLAPVAPLDGGRVVGAISRWLMPLGLVLLAAAFLYTMNLFLLFLGWLAVTQMIAVFRAARYMRAYYRIGIGARLYIAALYFGLAIGLGLALFVSRGLLFERGFALPFGF